MATTVADADVVVLADVSKFARDLKAKLTPILKKIVGTINVDADTKPAMREVRVAKRKIDRTEATIEVSTEIDGNQLRRVKREVIRSFDDTGKEISVKIRRTVGKPLLKGFAELGQESAQTFTKSITGAFSDFGQIAFKAISGNIAIITAAFVALAAVLPLIVIAIGGLVKLFIALLPLLNVVPGLLLAIGAGAGVAYLGLQNMGAALSGDEEALRKLAPSAREVVETLRDFAEPLRRIQQTVQQKIFEGLAAPLRDLGNFVLPLVEEAAGRVADSFNNVLRKALENLNSAAGQAQLDRIFENLADAVIAMEPASVAVSDALLAVAEAGSEIIKDIAPDIADFITDIAERIERFAESGDMKKAFDEAKEIAREVLDIVKELGSIGGSIIGPLVSGFAEAIPGDSTADKLRTIESLLADLSDTLKDPEFQQAIKDFGFALGLVSLGALKASSFVAGLIQKIAELWDNVKRIGMQIIAFFRGLPDEIRSALSTLVSVITSPFISAWNSVSSFVSSAVSNVVGFVAAIPGRIQGALGTLGSVLSGIFSSAWNTVIGVVRNVIGTLLGVVGGIPRRIAGALSGLATIGIRAGRSVVQGVIDGIRSMIGRLASVASTIASTVRNHLPFSPAKVGPLSGKGAPLFSGQAIVRDLAKGIMQEENKIGDASSGIASLIATALNQSLPNPFRAGSAQTFGGLPRFGDGGMVTKPTVAMVGEKGPELIVPIRNSRGSRSTHVTRTLSPTFNIHSSSGDPDAITNSVLRRITAAGGY